MGNCLLHKNRDELQTKRTNKNLRLITFVVGREELLIGSAVSGTHSLLITRRNKHKSSSLTSCAKGESPELKVLIEVIYVRILHTTPPRKDLSSGLT